MSSILNNMLLLPFQAAWLSLPRRSSELLPRLAISSPPQRLARPTIALSLIALSSAPILNLNNT